MMNMIYWEQRPISETDAHQPKSINLYHVGFDQATPWMYLVRYRALHDNAIVDFKSTENKPMYVAEGVRHGKSTIVVYRPCASDNEMKFVYYKKGGQDNE